MSTFLYVYEIEKLKSMQEEMRSYRFFSIAYLFHVSSTIEELEKMNAENLNNSIIDITNFIKDGNSFGIFSERYLRVLSEEFENVSFSLQSKYLDSFFEIFPYFFREEEINYDFQNGANDEPKALEIHPPLNLYIYEKIATIKRLYKDGHTISLSNLFEECEGILFKYNLKNIAYTIAKNKIDYIDLSSFIRTLNLRKDLIFQFEIMIHHISSMNDIKYCLDRSLLSEAIENFPLVFIDETYFDEVDDEAIIDSGESETIDIDIINSIANQISEKLQGHEDFKDDFKHNLMKFSFLNKMSERKILSILICGDSGIGKTEFAKVASNIMFPGEPIIKINFGNYSTEGVLNSLIGSPLGYIGSEEGGELINKIKTSQSKIILIDEFERATPSVFNFFYELLEDGKFTDRHGIGHKLDGYIIIFTSNMTQKQYQLHIPSSLKSRFDMVYCFTDLLLEDKTTFIQNTASSLIEKLKNTFDVQVEITSIKQQLDALVQYKNLRDIKRRIEDIVFSIFISFYKDNLS